MRKKFKKKSALTRKGKLSVRNRKFTFAIVLLLLFSLLLIIIFHQKSKRIVIKTLPHASSQMQPLTQKHAKQWEDGQIIVRFQDGVTSKTITPILTSVHASIKNQIPEVNAAVLTVPSGHEQEIVAILNKERVVQYAEPDYIYSLNIIPKDENFDKQWHLSNPGGMVEEYPAVQGDDIGATAAWDVTEGKGVKVAVVDTGLDLNNPEFKGNVIAQHTFDGSAMSDEVGHGTHCAGIIAAPIDSHGVVGVCPQCQLIIAKVSNGEQIDSSNIAGGITWSADQGAKVISMSFGAYEDAQVIHDAVTYAINKGSIMVSSAGNDSTSMLSYPAAYPGVVSVAATDATDKKAFFSNYGDWVNIAAPGLRIYSTTPTTPFLIQQKEPTTNTYGYMDGTSMAGPVVAGVAAVIWSTKYGTSANAVIKRMDDTAKKVDGTGQYWKFGRVDLAKAVDAPTGPKPVTPTYYCMRLGPGGCKLVPQK